MRKKTFVIFGLLVIVLVAVIPWLVFRSNGDAARGAQDVPSDLKEGQSLFQTNCGTCHTLYAAGTDGNYGPNLDELLAPNGPPTGPTAKQTVEGTENLVLETLENGLDTTTTPGRMPAGILSGAQAEEVSEFVARTAGEG
jgi:mono/diheme cytochrome c family protein